jgi:hypothetical protein
LYRLSWHSNSTSPWIRRVSKWPLRLATAALTVALVSGCGAAGGDAIVEGYVRLCGGPAPGRCFIETLGTCRPPDGCVTSDRVVVIGPQGRRVAQQKLHHARFHMRLPHGTYTVELLGDGKRVHWRVLQRKQVAARPHHTTVVTFLFAIP